MFSHWWQQMHTHFSMRTHKQVSVQQCMNTRARLEGICQALSVIQVKMKNKYIMYFSVYAVFARRTLCVVPTPSSKCKWPRFCQHFFFPTVPKTSKSKEEGRDVVCMCYQSLWASVCLLQSYSPYRRQPCLNSHRLPLTFLWLQPLRHATSSYRAPTEAPIVPSTYFQS